MPRRLSFTRLSLSEQPTVYISLAFIGGLIASAYFPFRTEAWVAIVIFLWAIASLTLLRYRDEWWHTSLLIICFGACGGLLWVIDEAGAGPKSLRRLVEQKELEAGEPVEIWGTLDAAPELAPDRIYLSVAVERTATLGCERETSGRAQITVPFRDDESRSEYDQLAIGYGSRLRMLALLSTKYGYRNPGAPKFDEMLEYRGFDAVGWVKSPLLIEKIGEGKSSRVLGWLYRIRSQALATTLRSFEQPAAGILSAALFGNRHFLSQSAAESFRAGGTFHLLVISGAHVAMIALVALWLMKFLSKSRLVQYSVVIALMCAYALMVGVEAAITRSVVMLSIALVGRLLFRAAVGPNTLAVTAIILLAWQPRDIFNPAFHLTFLTVLMIVAFTSPLYLRLKRIGEWQPSVLTPYPPRVHKGLKWMAEVLFWSEREFQVAMQEAHIRYRLEKSPMAIRLNRWRLQSSLAWVAITLFTTIGIQIGLLPLMILHFHRFSVISPIANVLESALIFILMIAGVAYLMIHSLIGGWALPLAKIVEAVGRLAVRSGDLLLVWRKASFRVPDWGDGWQWVFAAFFSSVLILIVCVNEWNPFRKGDESNDAKRRKIGRAATTVSTCALVLIGSLLVIHPFGHKYEPGRLSVTFLDVGQGDAILVRFPRGRLMMLDSGGIPDFTSRKDGDMKDGDMDEEVFVEDRIGIGEAAVMPFLWHLGVKRLDWIAASHADADHAGGFGETVRGFEVKSAMRGVTTKAGPDLFDKAVLLSGAPLQTVKRGDDFSIDGVRVEILSPVAGPDQQKMSENNESLVMRISFGQRAFLLTGDIEREAEQILTGSMSDLRADVLKVAHHGSRTSSTEEFLRQVRPQHAIISVAEPSPFGHPHPETLARLRLTGAHIWRTSRCGAITISTDGNDLRVETFVKCGSDGQSGDSASRSFPER